MSEHHDLSDQTLVWTQSMNQWAPAKDRPELAAVLAAAASCRSQAARRPPRRHRSPPPTSPADARLDGSACRTIETTAAISHGNSGGPLLLRCGPQDRFCWVGVNTWGVSGGNSLFFAIHAAEAANAKYLWYPADKHGAVRALAEVYRVQATVK